MYASKRSHSSVGMTSSTNNIEYDVNGIQSGECQTIFSSTITEFVTPLQTGGQSQNLNSITGSLERGNKGANCEGEKEYKFKEHKCVKCGSEDLCIANDWCDECFEKPNIPKKFRDSKPKTQKQCIKCDSPAVVHAFCADWCDNCWNAPIGEQPATVRLSSGSIVHMAPTPAATKPKIKIIKAEERQMRAELEKMNKEIKEVKEENKKLREIIDECDVHIEKVNSRREKPKGQIKQMKEDMKLIWFTTCTPPEWHDGKFYDKSVEIMEKWISPADLQNLKKQREMYFNGHAQVPILRGVEFE